MAKRQFQPHDDGRRWSHENIGYRRGGSVVRLKPRRRHRPPKGPEHIFATIVAILAFFGAISLGGIFLALLNQLTGH